MPKPRVGGLRSTLHSDEQEPQATVLPAPKNGKVVFRSSAPAYRLSIRRRIVKHAADGERYEDIPKTASGTPLDMVLFEDGLFETDDMELAAVLKDHKKHGLPQQGGEFWDVEIQRKAQDDAEVEELKRRLTARPDLMDRVFKPGTAEDFTMPERPPA